MADLKALVDDFVRKSYQAKNFAKEAKQAKETLLNTIVETGMVSDVELEINGSDHTVKVKEKKTRKWDSKELEALYGQTLPEFVSRKLSIADSIYESLSEEERDVLNNCFTPEATVVVRIIK